MKIWQNPQKTKKAVAFGLLGCAGIVIAFANTSYFGWKGILFSERENMCLLPSTYSLSIQESLPHREWELDLQSLIKEKPLQRSKGPLKVEILKYIPNAVQKFKCFCKDSVFLSFSSNPLSLLEFTKTALFHPLAVRLNEREWDIAAFHTPSIGEAAAALSAVRRSQNPLIAFIQDDSDREYLLLQEEQTHLISIEALLKKGSIRSKQGAQLEVEIPFSKEKLNIPIHSSLHILPSKASFEENTPCIFALFTEGSQHENISLIYDPNATSFRWPLFQGKYSARFQPSTRPLPFQVKLDNWNCSHDALETHTEKCHASLSVTDVRGKEQKQQLQYGKPLKLKGGYTLQLDGEHLQVHYSPFKGLWGYVLLVLMGLGGLFYSFKKSRSGRSGF